MAGARKLLPVVILLCDLDATAQIAQFDCAAAGEEHVGGFDVPVDSAL